VGKVVDSINEHIQEFIAAQHMYFVATAPLTETGHINLSPKGTDTFRVLSSNRVAYLDMTGSGNETSAHLTENGRITIMFCAFDGAPNILRLYGQGHTILPDSPEWAEFAVHFTLAVGYRQIIVADIDRVQTSCGYGVPFYDYVGERDQMARWAEAKGEDGLEKYRQQNNLCSIDGLPSALAVDIDPAS
jgi:hypothetical protein